MPLMNVRPFRPANNASIMNAIRNDASSSYQSRIPAATQASIQDSVNAMLNYRPAYNEFVDALVNQIGLIIARNNSWTNPLAKFKIGNLEFGDTIEEIGVGLVNAYVYDSEREYLEKDIFGQERPEVQASFHKINRQNFYKISINRAMLQRAFTSEQGLYNLINQLMEAPATSDQWDEFLVMCNLFAEYERNDGFFKIQIPDVAAEGSTPAEAKYALRRIRETADNLTFISRTYNAAGLPVAAQREDLELFVTPEFNAAIDVEALAAAFNIERANVPMKITVIPKERFGISGAQAILTTKDFFIIADSLFETTSAENPAGLHTNYFLHHHQVISASRFVPAILLTIHEGTVIEDDIAPVTGTTDIVISTTAGAVATDLTRGERYEVFSSAVTTPAGGDSAMRYWITGAESPRTYITQKGTLHIASDEDAFTLTIHASAVDADMNEFNESTTRDIIGDKESIWPVGDTMTDDDTDGLLETAVPEAPTFDAATDDITIPEASEGFEYRIAGVAQEPGELHIVADTTVTANALAGYEIPAGSTVSWPFTV